MSEQERLLVTAKEAARMLSLNVYEVYDLVHHGQLERRYIGTGRHYFRIPVASVRAYVESLPTEPTEPVEAV